MNKNIVHIENWSVIGTNVINPYIAPELIKKHLRGNIYQHPLHENGKEIITSSIVETSGRYITTKSGTIYELGKIDKSYLVWMVENEIEYDKNEPIKMKE